MTLHITEQNPDATDTVVFIHGGNVAGWMWEAQTAALPDFHTIVPDLPGFGASRGERWESLADTADRIAAIIRERAHGGTAHVVGLSLGGIIGTVLVARHPELVRSAMLTGAPLLGVHGLARWAGILQLRMWGSRGYWKALAKAYRMPDDVTEVFIETGLAIDRPSARRMMLETYAGVHDQLPGLVGNPVPLLVLAGEKDDPSVAASFPEFTSRATAATTRIVPKMHHAWNAEDPELFNRIMREWLISRTASAELMAR
jgi:pimeloyl-ACP methyl ester carboxylesterase